MQQVTLYDSAGLLIKKSAPVIPNGDPTFFIPKNSSKNADQLSRPYSSHSWVYACAHAISTNIAQLAPVMYKSSSQEKLETEHDYLTLLKNPNPYMHGSDLVEMTILNLLLPTMSTLGGQCFWILESKSEKFIDLKKGELPFEIYPFSDELIHPVMDTNGVLTGWSLELPNGRKIIYGLNQIIRFKLANPYDLTRGLSPYSAARGTIEGDIKAVALNNRFLDNNASLGGVLTTDKVLVDAQIEQLRTGWTNQYSGPDNGGRTAILHSGLKFEQMSRTHSDMQFMEQKKFNLDEIRAVYGVPKFAIGMYEDLNYATADAAKKFFWDSTLLPYCKLFWETLNAAQIQYIEPELRGGFDYSSVEALQDSYNSKIVSWVSMVDRGVPMDRAAALLHIPLDVTNAEYMKNPYVKGQVVNLDTGEVIGQAPVPDTTIDPTQPEKPTEPIVEDPKKALSRTLDSLIEDIATEEKELSDFWYSYVARVLDPGEKGFEVNIKKYLYAQRNLMLDNIDEWSKKSGDKKALAFIDLITKAKKKPNPDDFLPSKSKENAKLAKLVEPLYRKQIKVEADNMAKEIGDFVFWDEKDPSVQKYLDERIKEIQKINTTTFNKARDVIADVISTSVDQQLNNAEVTKLLKEEIGKVFDIRTSQAKTIARTEISSISSKTRFDIMKTEEIEYHKWISSRDSKVRHDHAPRTGDDNTVIAIGKDFPHTGLKFPLDPSGEAGQIINCRCVTVAAKKK